MLWETLREEEFEGAIARSGGLCVIPLGCIEKHGQHLPVGTDYLEGLDVVKCAAEIEDVVIFPTGAWLGEVSCFHSFSDPFSRKLAGCIGIKQSTILAVLSELCDEIARNGFRKILIVNCHGGNNALLAHFIRTVTYENKDYATMSTFALDFAAINPGRLLNAAQKRKQEFPDLTMRDIEVIRGYVKTGYGGGHGDFRETSLIMAYDESLVREDRYDAESGESTHRTDYLAELGVDSANQWLANYPNSYSALPPYGASPAIGRLMRRLSAERLARIFKVLKADDDCIKSASMKDKE